MSLSGTTIQGLILAGGQKAREWELDKALFDLWPRQPPLLHIICPNEIELIYPKSQWR